MVFIFKLHLYTMPHLGLANMCNYLFRVDQVKYDRPMKWLTNQVRLKVYPDQNLNTLLPHLVMHRNTRLHRLARSVNMHYWRLTSTCFLFTEIYRCRQCCVLCTDFEASRSISYIQYTVHFICTKRVEIHPGSLTIRSTLTTIARDLRIPLLIIRLRLFEGRQIMQIHQR